MMLVACGSALPAARLSVSDVERLKLSERHHAVVFVDQNIIYSDCESGPLKFPYFECIYVRQCTLGWFRPLLYGKLIR